MKTDSFLYYSFGPAGKSAQPIYSPRALPHPGRNLGLGRQSHARALARLGRGSARSSTAVGSHPTVTRRLRGVKTTLGPRRMKTLGHLLRSSLSLRSRAQPSESESSDHGELGGGASLGAVAGPLAGARAPQRVSTPPSSGLAAAPPFPSPASSCPGLAFLLPCAGVTATLHGGEVSHPLPLLSPVVLILFSCSQIRPIGDS